MTRPLAIATMLGCLAAMTIGCVEGADPAAALSGTALSVEIDELESFVNCDPPDNPNGGDFRG